MPKLKAALASHQYAAQRAAAAKRRDAHEKSKLESVKVSSSGQKKAKKRAKIQSAKAGTTTLALSTAIDTGSSNNGQIAQQEIVAGPSDNSKPLSFWNAGKGKSKATIPVSRDDTILLLGEANFSFAHSLIMHHAHPPYLILATSYDSEQVCYQKYPDAKGMVQELRDSGAGVEFGVDGGKLEACKKVGKGRWSRVIMNFPHTGSGIKDQDRNIRDNQLLLLRVLRSVKPVLTSGPDELLPGSHAGEVKTNKKRHRDAGDDVDDVGEGDEVAFGGPAGEVTDEEELDEDEVPDLSILDNSSKTFVSPRRPGTVLITLLDQPPYTLWALKSLATRPPHVCPGTKLPQPKYQLLRSFKFEPASYPGYAHRRTLGFKEGLSKGENEEIMGRKGEARTWEFAPTRSQVGA